MPVGPSFLVTFLGVFHTRGSNCPAVTGMTTVTACVLGPDASLALWKSSDRPGFRTSGAAPIGTVAANIINSCLEAWAASDEAMCRAAMGQTYCGPRGCKCGDALCGNVVEHLLRSFCQPTSAHVSKQIVRIRRTIPVVFVLQFHIHFVSCRHVCSMLPG